jgi:hypothetical protein
MIPSPDPQLLEDYNVFTELVIDVLVFFGELLVQFAQLFS